MKKPKIHVNDMVYGKLSSYVFLLAAMNWFNTEEEYNFLSWGWKGGGDVFGCMHVCEYNLSYI